MPLVTDYGVEHKSLIHDQPAYSTPLKLDRALAIPGWMRVSELVWLALQATGHSRIAEVGSYLGRSTRALADNTSGWVLAVDHWRDAEVLTSFCENCNIPNIRTFPFDHQECDPLANAPYDMIFLDGDHSYDAVKRDIATWLPHLSPGGLLCGHDFSYEGVHRAVLERFGVVHLAALTQIWYWESPCTG